MKKVLAALAALTTLLALVGTAAPAGAASDGLWQYVPTSIGGTYTPLVGYFDNNATTDVLWYAPGGAADTLWLSRTGQRGSFLKISEPVSGTYRPIVGNFAGDARDDILWYAPGSAADPLWVANDSTARFDKTHTLSVSGTFTPFVLHDYRTATTHDNVVWHASSGNDPVWNFADATTSAKPSFVSSSISTGAGTTPVVGDWNFDGLDDLFSYGAGTKPDARWISRPAGGFTKTAMTVNGTFRPVKVSGTGDSTMPPAADSILWWGDGAGTEAYWRSNGTSFVSTPVPTVDVSAKVVPLSYGVDLVYAPYDVDGLFIDDETGADYYPSNFSGRDVGPGYQPLVGDFDGDFGPDILWYAPGSAADEIWFFDGGASAAAMSRSTQGGSTPQRLQNLQVPHRPRS